MTRSSTISAQELSALLAVMHRDYSDSSGHVAVAVFDDRIEIRSGGRFLAGVTVESLSGHHLSRLRNPLIAETFHRTGAVEIWGRGMNRVIAECERHGAAPPTFEERQGFVIVTFRADLVPEAAGTTVLGEGREKSREKSREKILRMVAANPAITIQELAASLDFSRAGIEKVIRRLKKEGRLKRLGPDKGGRWEVVP